MAVHLRLAVAKRAFQFFRLILFVLITGLYTLCDGYALTVEFKPGDGLFQVQEETDVLLDASYVGWTKDWKWDRPIVTPGITTANEQSFDVSFPSQSAEGEAKLSVDRNNIQYSYLIEFDKTISDTIGSGIEFRLSTDLQRLRSDFNEPYLLPNNKGWAWDIAPGKTIRVSFSPHVASIQFDRNKSSRIRVFFFQDNISPGQQQVVMEIHLPEDSTVADVAGIYTPVDFSNWIENALHMKKSFIDLSWLNEKPAGQHGFVRAEGDHFVFDDGVEARFWGVNVQAHSLFIQDKTLIKTHARRLAQLGVNLVRLHHHDSATWVRSSLIKDSETTQEIDEQSLDSYFWWIKCLREEGIYVWVDLQGMRPWREGDNIPGWDTDMSDDVKRGMSVSKGFVYLNERMKVLTKQFSEALLTRVNPYTGQAIKDDPAVMGMLITNENDITNHFGNSFLADKRNPYHQKLFENEIEKYAEKHNLPERDLGRTWEAGISKLLLNEIEGRFNREMIDYLRTLGVKVPIATTNLWGRNALFSLPSLTLGDMIDTHAYAAENSLFKNPRYSANFTHWLGQGQVSGKPMTVSEYNFSRKENVENEGFIVLPYVAATAAFQGWDAMMLYGYSQDRFRGRTLSPWSSYMNPAIAGLMPATALMYREKHVSQAKKTMAISLDNQSLYYERTTPQSSKTLRTVFEQHRMVITLPETDELSWVVSTDTGEAANRISDVNKDTLPDQQSYVKSDTGEITRDWKKGVLILDTSKSQGAAGSIGGERIRLTDVALDIKTPRATVILTSLDGEDLNSSREFLISTAARVREIKESKWYTVESEIVTGQIEFFSKIKNLKVWPLLSNGKRGKEIPVRYSNKNSYLINLPEDTGTHWFLVENIR